MSATQDFASILFGAGAYIACGAKNSTSSELMFESDDLIARIDARIAGIEPAVSRTLELPFSLTLAQLHDVLQAHSDGRTIICTASRLAASTMVRSIPKKMTAAGGPLIQTRSACTTSRCVTADRWSFSMNMILVTAGSTS